MTATFPQSMDPDPDLNILQDVPPNIEQPFASYLKDIPGFADPFLSMPTEEKSFPTMEDNTLSHYELAERTIYIKQVNYLRCHTLGITRNGKSGTWKFE